MDEKAALIARLRGDRGSIIERLKGADVAAAIGYRDLPTDSQVGGWAPPKIDPAQHRMSDFSKMTSVNPEKSWARMIPEAGMGLGTGKALGIMANYAKNLPNIGKLLRIGSKSLLNPDTAVQSMVGGGIEGAMAGAIDPNLTAMKGATGGMIGGAIANKIPQLALGGVKADPRAQRLTDQGIDLTTGERLGGAWSTMEEKLISVPVLGNSVRNAKNRSIESFTRNRSDNVLKEIGESLPDRVPSGRDATAYTQDRLTKRYDDVLSKMTINEDAIFNKEVNDILGMVEKLPQGDRTAIHRTVQDALIDPFNNSNKVLLGQTYKESETLLRTTAEKMIRSDNVNTTNAGHALDEIRKSFKKLSHRQNPEQAIELDELTRAYAKRSVNVDAANAIGAEDGIYNPSQYLRAVKKGSKGNQFAYGRAPEQELADDAKAVIAQKINNSGTEDRNAMLGALGLGAGASVVAPTAIPIAGAAYSAYTKPGQKMINKALFDRPVATNKLLKKFGPRVSQLGGLLGVESTRDDEQIASLKRLLGLLD